jgi:aryl sulfotransferase
MTGHIYWLASYPKSGNTWMRILLTNYLRDGDEPADINTLDGGPIASARQLFDDNVGIEASDLTQDEIERLRPYVYEMISESYGRAAEDQPCDPVFLKVHDAYTYTPENIPLLSKAATAGAIYLLRNPLDVADSFAHHSAQPVEKTVERMGSDDFAFVDKETRLHNQLRQRLLTWSGHVQSWLDEPGLRSLIVRYEDLSEDTENVLSEVLHFSGIKPDSKRVAKAVDFSRFDRLKEQEAKQGFGEKMPLAESFFRKGKVGSWTDSLTPEHMAKIIDDHGEVMTRFGYLPLD